MADLSNYSATQQEVIKKIVENDNGFHSSIMISDIPLIDIISYADNDMQNIARNASVNLSSFGKNYTLTVNYSEMQKCWFFVLSYSENEVRGIIHFNTLYQAKAPVSFAFINDTSSDEIDSISQSLAYSNILIMEK